jgi:proton-dependent oligopeptide transporter, POT family
MNATPNFPPGEILGHPRPLWMLFFAEFWERFAYYGMRALLAAYVATAFFGHLESGKANEAASLAYGGYTALVYGLGVFGGYIADRILGYQRAIMLGGVFMAIGLFLLLAPQFNVFLLGLATIVVGNGLFKPNISTMVGMLYAPGDARRDSGFTIFYMGINAGALLAPLICGVWIGEVYGLKYGFAAAGVGMIFGIMVFHYLSGMLGEVGKPPAGHESFAVVGQVAIGLVIAIPIMYFLLSKSSVLGGILGVMMIGLVGYLIYCGMKSGDSAQTQRYIAMAILFLANMCFWALFEQAGSSLNFLARDFVTMPTLFGTTLNFTVFQSANPMFILLFGPVFALLWPALDKMNFNPSTPAKFGLALIQVALGFYVLVWAIGAVADTGVKLHYGWLLLCYMLHTTGELCLSPIGLSMITKLAAPKEVGVAMGGWFLSTACANFIAGLIAAVASGGGGHGEAASSLGQYASTFEQLVWLGLLFGGVYLLMSPLIKKLMHGVK